jgi:hypothetical protein
MIFRFFCLLLSINGFSQIITNTSIILANTKAKDTICSLSLINKKDSVSKTENKVVQLKEVIIYKVPNFKLKYDYDKSAFVKMIKDQELVNDQTQYGINLIAGGKKIIDAFVKKKQKPKNEIFIESIKKKFSEDYFVKNLNLDRNDIYLFLEFCNQDKDLKQITESNNILSLIDFLERKKKEFSSLKNQQ